jgi:hypothetical protein
LIKIVEDFKEFTVAEKAMLAKKRQLLQLKERQEKIEEMKLFSRAFKLPSAFKPPTAQPASRNHLESDSPRDSGVKMNPPTVLKNVSYSQVATATSNQSKLENSNSNSEKKSPLKESRLSVKAASFTPNVNASPFVPVNSIYSENDDED